MTMTTIPETRGRPPKYPWDKWLSPKNSDVQHLVQGQDFDCSPKALLNKLRERAAKKGMRIHGAIVETVIYYEILEHPDTPLS